MDETSENIDHVFQSLEVTVPNVIKNHETNGISEIEKIKNNKKHKKSKKHKKHKKSKKKKKHSRSKSPKDHVKLKLKNDELKEVKSHIQVTLNDVLETIITTPNEENTELKNNTIVEEFSNGQKSLIGEDKISTTNLISKNINNSSKIIIKDLKKSKVYHELINEVEEKKSSKTKLNEVNTLSESYDDYKFKKEKHKSHKSRRKKRSRSNDRSRSPKHRKRQNSSSKKDERTLSKQSNHKHHQSRSPSRSRNTSNSMYRKRKSRSRSLHKYESYKSNKRSKTPDKTHSRDHRRRSRSRECERPQKRSRSNETSNKLSKYHSPSCEKIDKKKLLKIARKNALSLVQQGVLPVGSVKKESLANLPTKSVDELTDFCRKLSKKEKENGDDSLSSTSDEESKQPFHHPFLVKDRPNIVMNIRNATQLPTKSFQEKTVEQDVLRLQFPVSSGQTHSLAVNEWVPLCPEESAKLNKISLPGETLKSNKPQNASTLPKIAMVEPFNKDASPKEELVSISYQYPKVIEPQPVPPTNLVPTNPYANIGYSLLSYETGQFTGHTGAKILTPAELATGYQPWVKKDQLRNTAPVNSGMGMHLLQKMGWKPGEGLGKNQSGSLEPLLLDVKIDKKGLVSAEEENQSIFINRSNKRFPKKAAIPTLSLEGKHPVSLLNEFCAKRKWEVPKFDTLDESGPSHRKTFIIAVIVNGVKYCSSRCQTKKLAKMDAAKICLKEIGLLT
ncbi:protein SON [Daktulosphaira vitifoliae]|uniref:protein SON n=1 Tax=Daktulosphaira vitifoliae TaxID=58002 RepID=UPI0021AAE5B8|nr:protein SON [Daktulosphaira vitifoliae]